MEKYGKKSLYKGIFKGERVGGGCTFCNSAVYENFSGGKNNPKKIGKNIRPAKAVCQDAGGGGKISGTESGMV